MKMIYEYARNRAGLVPDKIAISLDNEHLSYWKLETQSNQLAELLIRHGLKPGDRVGLLLRKSPKAITAMHGINKAGGIYVPLDVHSPAERVAKIISSAAPSFLFTDATAKSLFRRLTNLQPTNNISTIWWDDKQPEEMDQFDFLFHYDGIHNEPDFPHAVSPDPYAPAQILFTSGSTGVPKGVIVTHQNIISFVDWAKHYFEMNEDDRVSCHSPLHFDLSTFDIYGAMSVGARVFLVPPDARIHPQKLTHFIAENRLTQWFSVPSALSYLANFKAIHKRAFPTLKRLIWCGEVFPTSSLRYWMEQLPHVQFTNLYGPTEATIASSYHTVFQIPGAHDQVPIGRACAGEQLWVLNDEMQPTNIDEVGDLYISGLGLSPGYWGDEAKTKAAFTLWTNPEGREIRIYKTGDMASLGRDLNIYFHGRSDYQIKSRGYRIELGEIEQALSELNMLGEFVVVPVERTGFEGVTIGCAYVVKQGKEPFSINELKKKLQEKIPTYMLPGVWKSFAVLPRNANGKIDRKQLSNELAEHPQTAPKLLPQNNLVSHC